MSERHNPAYKELLGTIGREIFPDLLRPLDPKEKQVLDLPIYRMTAELLEQAKIQLHFMGTFDNLSDKGLQREVAVIRGINAPTWSEETASYVHNLRSWNDLSADLRPDVKRMDHVMVFQFAPSDHESDFNTETLGIVDDRKAYAIANTLRIIAERINPNRRLIGDIAAKHPITPHLARVVDYNRKENASERVTDTYIEGFISIAQAHAQLEADAVARGITMTTQQMKHAIARYTAKLPYAGIIGPMAERGDYFVNLYDTLHVLNPKYEHFFDHLYKDIEENKEGNKPLIESHRFRAPNEGERCPAIGIVLRTSMDAYFQIYESLYRGQTDASPQFSEFPHVINRLRAATVYRR